jgi:succinate dehydrogenase / fumarate reductase cytochrome b subunit
MAFGKQIGLKGLTYQGGGSMLSWWLNRIAGLGILIFVALHVLASFMTQQGFASDTGIAINTIYESWQFQIFIIYCVLFHTIHGLRVIVLDFWPQFLKFQREALWLQWFIFIPVYGLTIYILVTRALSGQ